MSDLTLDQAASLTAGGAMWASVAIAEAGISSFMMSDGPMGIASGRVDERDIALLSPCGTALGASWDVELVQRIGALVGQEAVDRRIDAVLAPNINLARSPLAGRAFEYFSEDPLLAGVLGARWIAGLQSTGTGAIAKHLVCNDSETDRDHVDVQVDERTLREVYLLPFEFAARAGCAGMLAAYNRVNGRYCAEQHHVLTTVVKGDWAYRGAIMSDWFGTYSTVATLAGGLDLEMPGPFRHLGPKSAAAVTAGEVPAERVQDAAARVATLARAVTGPKSRPHSVDAAEALLVDAAAAGMVLLRNEGALLPLAPESIRTLAVIGPNAAAPCFQGGTFAKISISPDLASPIDAIRARYEADCAVVFEPGVDPQPRLPNMSVRPGIQIGDGAQRGMTIEYFATSDLSGKPMSRETRDTNSLVWFVGVHEQANFAAGGSIRASGVYTAKRAGIHRFHLGATGVSRMLVDGRALAATTQCPPGDVMGVLKAGDSQVADLDLAEGQAVHIAVEFRFDPARVHGLWYGIRAPGSAEELLAAAEAAARAADAVILLVGETSDSSVESKDRSDTKLADGQLALIERVTAANPRTAIVANVGHAFDTAWEERAASLLCVWYPGQGFAAAVAGVLAGDREPGGRMPVTIAREESDYPGYALAPDADGRLQYDDGTRFGYRGIADARHTLGSGTGYASFDWQNPRVEDGGVAIDIVNRSARAGSEVVQVYRDTPETALIGFAKVRLDPGARTTVSIPLPKRRLMTWSDAGWTSIADRVTVRISRDARDAGYPLDVTVDTLAQEGI